jgi:hypothetical protein
VEEGWPTPKGRAKEPEGGKRDTEEEGGGAAEAATRAETWAAESMSSCRITRSEWPKHCQWFAIQACQSGARTAEAAAPMGGGGEVGGMTGRIRQLGTGGAPEEVEGGEAEDAGEGAGHLEPASGDGERNKPDLRAWLTTWSRVDESNSSEAPRGGGERAAGGTEPRAKGEPKAGAE